MWIPQCAYAFICWQIFGLPWFLIVINKTAMNILAHYFIVMFSFTKYLEMKLLHHGWSVCLNMWETFKYLYFVGLPFYTPTIIVTAISISGVFIIIIVINIIWCKSQNVIPGGEMTNNAKHLFISSLAILFFMKYQFKSI